MKDSLYWYTNLTLLYYYRFLKLENSISLLEAITKVKELTRLEHVRFAIGKGKALSDSVETVALCAGSGSSVLKGVAADLYLTG